MPRLTTQRRAASSSIRTSNLCDSLLFGGQEGPISLSSWYTSPRRFTTSTMVGRLSGSALWVCVVVACKQPRANYIPLRMFSHQPKKKQRMGSPSHEWQREVRKHTSSTTPSALHSQTGLQNTMLRLSKEGASLQGNTHILLSRPRMPAWQCHLPHPILQFTTGKWNRIYIE